MSIMKTKNLFILSALIFCISCTSNKQETNDEIVYPVEIKISEKGNAKQVSVLDIIDIKNVISLEGNEDCYIKEATKVIMTAGNIYIFDKPQKKLFKFNKEGKFISQLLTIGKGPGEVGYPYDFDIDIESERILILNSQKKELLILNLKGEYQGVIKNDFASYYFACIDSAHYCYYLSIYHESLHNLHITDNKGELLKMDFPFPENITFIHIGFSGDISKNYEGLLYSEACSNNIYQIDKTGDIFHKYRIVFDGIVWPEKRRHEHMEFIKGYGNLEFSFLRSNFIENHNGLFIPYGNSKGWLYAFYHKNTGKVYNKLVIDEFYYCFSSPAGLSENDHFISVLDPLLLKDYLTEEKESLKEMNIDKKLHTKVMEADENTSNMILVFFDIKESKR